jgi:radical SAM protein with 4Fe4S-binding SPASM domain
VSAVGSYVQSVLAKLIEGIGIRSVVFEVAQECNQDCAFCYNVWKGGEYSLGRLDTPRTIDLLDRILAFRPQLLTFSGGEPLLRSDLTELIRHIPRLVSVNLITNGILMTDERAIELVDAGVRMFEFTLLSADREIHNSLVRRDSFDEMIEGIASVRAAGGAVSTTFVAMRQNIDGWAEALELNVALGADGILFNRYNIGGAGIARAPDLVPTVEQLKTALAIADEGMAKYGIGISMGVPIPPCVLDRSPYKHIGFGDCPVGTKRAYPTVDPLGNVRPCNHSPTILGNLFTEPMADIMDGERYRSYAQATPSACAGCEHLRSCRGGCRAAAEVCGVGDGLDPFVRLCSCRGEW